MNSLIFDIANMLRENEKLQNGLDIYQIKEVKTYYDLEYSLRIAIKVYNRTIDEDEIFILNMENIEDFDSIEDKEKWFEELN